MQTISQMDKRKSYSTIRAPSSKYNGYHGQNLNYSTVEHHHLLESPKLFNKSKLQTKSSIYRDRYETVNQTIQPFAER